MYNERDFMRLMLMFLYSYQIVTSDLLAVKTTIDNDDDDDDEEENRIDHRILPREKKRKMNHNRARHCIQEDYLDANARFYGIEFKKMFRITRPQFEYIACEMAKLTTFYSERVDATGSIGSCVQGKFMIALKSLAN